MTAPTPTFPTCSPSDVGIDARGVLAFLDAMEADRGIEPHGLIVQRHGRRAVEAWWAPHAPGRIRLVYSLSKTFTGTALALAIGEGRLTLDDRVLDHLPELAAVAAPGLRDLRIRHIASMSTGHDHETILEALARDPDDLVRGFVQLPPEREPGSVFAYNQPPVATLATILQRLTGERLVDYLRPRLLDPLGIGDLRWASSPHGVDLGFSGVYADLDAIARLGQLHLDDGVWQGRRLLPDGWVADASRPHIANPLEPTIDWQQGYGFQLWMSQHGYRGDGAFGQYMLVLPEVDAVVAFVSHTPEMQRVMDLVWQHLLPAMAGGSTSAAADRELADRCASTVAPTAAQRRRLPAAVGAAAHARLVPGAKSELTHRAVRAVDLDGDVAVVHEGEVDVVVPLTPGWSLLAQGSLAASSVTDAGGRIHIDVLALHTPHRAKLVLDPNAGTFAATWPVLPLFGAGLGTRLASMCPPPA